MASSLLCKTILYMAIKVSLNFRRLLWVVFSSQQRLNRPAVNTVQWRHYPKIGWWFWLVDCPNVCTIMYKQLCIIMSVFLKCSVCVFLKLISFRDCDRVWLLNYNRFVYFLHGLKQRSSDVTGQHQRLVDVDVTEGVKTTRSNHLKFRLDKGTK